MEIPRIGVTWRDLAQGGGGWLTPAGTTGIDLFDKVGGGRAGVFKREFLYYDTVIVE
jgi:hypothetical protein